MSWRYVDPLLEKLSKHSTIITKYWVCLVVIFRLTILAFAERVWSDEQKEFKCNTKEVGCDNVCFNRFTPISNVRLWGLQLLALCIPSALYLVYIWHLVSRAQHDQEDQKQKNRAMKALVDVRNKSDKLRQQQLNSAGNLESALGALGLPGQGPGGHAVSAPTAAALAPDHGHNTSHNNSAQIGNHVNNQNNHHPQNTNNSNNVALLNSVSPVISNQIRHRPVAVSKFNTNSNNNKDLKADPKPDNNYVNQWINTTRPKGKNIPSESNRPLSSAERSKATAELQNMRKQLKKYEAYDRFNRTILPNDWRSEAKKRPRNERNIWRCYILQLVTRTILDVFFVYLQWSIYPYTYVIPELYICGHAEQSQLTYPCRHQVDCFVSRPYEKTVFFIYFYIVAIFCFLLNIFEFWYIGFERLRHTFSPVNEKKLQDMEKANQENLQKEQAAKAQAMGVVPDLIQANTIFPTANREMPKQIPRKPNSNKNLNNNLLMNPPDYEPSTAVNIYVPPKEEKRELSKTPKSSQKSPANLANNSPANFQPRHGQLGVPVDNSSWKIPPGEQNNKAYYGDVDYQSYLNAQDDLEAQELAANRKLQSIYDTALQSEPAPSIGVAGIVDPNLQLRRGSSPVLKACRRELSHYAGGGGGNHHRYSRRPRLFRNSTRMPDMAEGQDDGGREEDQYDQYDYGNDVI